MYRCVWLLWMVVETVGVGVTCSVLPTTKPTITTPQPTPANAYPSQAQHPTLKNPPTYNLTATCNALICSHACSLMYTHLLISSPSHLYDPSPTTGVDQERALSCIFSTACMAEACLHTASSSQLCELYSLSQEKACQFYSHHSAFCAFVLCV